MKVACATEPMSSYFSPYFDGMTVIGSAEKLSADVDLLILTGGADISPSRYGERYQGAIGCIPSRDADEFDIVSKFLRIKNYPKILGVCRGHQLLNIQLGGDLVQNMKISHPGTHTVEWSENHPLSWLETVNSMHHQAIKNIGRNVTGYVLGREPETGVIEAALWGDFAFGVQFHPEFFSEDIGEKFFSIVKSWVKGEVSLLGDLRYSHTDDEDTGDDDEDNNDDDTGDEEETRPSSLIFEYINNLEPPTDLNTRIITNE